MEVPPLPRSKKPGDVPGPRLVGPAGHDLGLRMVRVAALGAALADRPVLGQNPVHRALGAQVDAFVQQRRVHCGSAVREARRAQHLEHLRPLRFAQGPGRRRPGLPLPGLLRPPATVVRRVRNPQRLARGSHAHVPGKLSGRAQEDFPSPRLNPSSPDTFPWTSMTIRALRSSSRRRAFSRSSLRRFFKSRFPAEGFGPRFLASSRSDPSRAAFRHALVGGVASVPCCLPHLASNRTPYDPVSPDP